MRLDEFEQTRVGSNMRYAARLADDQGDEAYQLLLVGSESQIRKAFGKSDFQVTISPRVSQREWEASTARNLGVGEQAMVADAFDDLPSLFKKPAPDPSARNSVVCALRRERPGGTGFLLIVPVFVATGRNVLFVFPPAFVAGGSVRPVTGDPDLFLHVNSFLGPIVSFSMLGGLATDSVGFTTPPFFQWVPVFRVFGFAASATTFVGSSFGLP